MATPQQRATEALAVVSLVTGVAQFFVLLPATITAIVTGHLARRRIRRAQGTLEGDGMAIAGLTLGYIGLAFQALVIAAIATLFVSTSGTTVERIGTAQVLPATAFVQDLQRDAGGNSSVSLRDATAIHRVVEANAIYREAQLADGTPLARATQSQLARDGWRVQFGADSDTGVVCLTIPAKALDQPRIDQGRC